VTFKLPAAALCGRYFIRGMAAFWLLLLLFLLLPAEPVWLLQAIIALWLGSFVLTLSSYLLLLLHRLGLFDSTDN
jgi:hypothetical protein